METTFEEAEFAHLLSANIRPAKPIESPHLLQGRQAILRDIDRTLYSPGMHIFIYGERGVGKTSTALIAAKTRTEGEVLAVGCDETSTMVQIVRDICRVLLDARLLTRSGETSGTAGVNTGLFKLELSRKGFPSWNIPEHIKGVNEAASLIDECLKTRGDSPVVIIDEMDRVKSDEFKREFSDLIKRIHDKRIGITFIMCGIGKNIDEIIGSHLSAHRAIAPIELPRISMDARWAILGQAADAVGFEVPKEHYIRVSQISDGYPYYVHLFSEGYLWSIFDHSKFSKLGTTEDFHSATTRSIERAEPPLRNSYNFATQKTTGSYDYEEVLWSVAAQTHFDRQIVEIYNRSYLPIIDTRRYATKNYDRKPLEIEQFRKRLYSLCSDRHGSILIKKRNSWYSFTENVVRGYVRLVAERNGIQLGSDHF